MPPCGRTDTRQGVRCPGWALGRVEVVLVNSVDDVPSLLVDSCPPPYQVEVLLLFSLLRHRSHLAAGQELFNQ
jgi:hypothetical protein